MKKRNLCSIISAIMSCVVVIYCIVVLIIDSNLQYYSLDSNSNGAWTVLLICMCIGNLVLMILSKSRVAYYLSVFSLFPYMCLIHNKYMMIIIPAIYLVAYLISTKTSVIAFGGTVCVFLLIIVALASCDSDSSWSQTIETVGMDYYLSPDGETEVRVEVSYWFEKIEDYYDTYSYSVTVHEVNLINLGPLVYDGTFHEVYEEEKLSEKPNVEIEWIDNDTFLINGEPYNVSDYIS